MEHSIVHYACFACKQVSIVKISTIVKRIGKDAAPSLSTSSREVAMECGIDQFMPVLPSRVTCLDWGLSSVSLYSSTTAVGTGCWNNLSQQWDWPNGLLSTATSERSLTYLTDVDKYLSAVGGQCSLEHPSWLQDTTRSNPVYNQPHLATAQSATLHYTPLG